MRDLYNNATIKTLLAAKRQSGEASESLTVETGTAVNLQGEGRKCLLLVSVGATATATLYITIQESPDNSTWTTLHGANYDTTGTDIVDLTPAYKYVRAVAAISATGLVANTWVDCAVGIVVYNERFRPSNVA